MLKRKQNWRLEMRQVREVLRLTEAGRSQTEIAQSCRIARSTVREYQRKAAAAGLSSERVRRMSEAELEAAFGKKRPGRVRSFGELDYFNLQRELTRKGVTLYLLWQEYLVEHPDGYSYSRFCELFTAWRKTQKLSLRQEYKAGEKVLVDFAGMTVPIYPSAEVQFEASIFVSTLGASNLLYAEAVRGEDLNSWLGAHARCFEYYGGVPEAAVPDNLKSGVTKACFYDPVINASYQELAEHYGIAVLPARSGKPRDKSKVEQAVQLIERHILAPLRHRRFLSLAELNAAIKELLETLNNRQMKVYGCSRRELFEQVEKAALKPLPAQQYRIGRWRSAKVNIDYHVEVDRRYYSVPYQLRGERLEVCVREKTVEIYREQKRIALHPVVPRRGMHSTLKEHMPQEHRYMQEWSPSRFLSWGAKIGSETQQQIAALLESRAHPEQGYRACLGLLRMEKRYGRERLEAACRRANHFGIVSMRRIKSMLEHGQDRLSIEEPRASSRSAHGNVRGGTYYH
jgi:transposase